MRPQALKVSNEEVTAFCWGGLDACEKVLGGGEGGGLSGGVCRKFKGLSEF